MSLTITRFVRRLARAMSAALAVSLAACSSLPTAPATDTRLSGRLSVRVASEPPRSMSAGFELDGDEREGRLALTNPLGNIVGEARWTPQQATLRSADGEQRTYADLDSLAEDALGDRLPMAALFRWLRGEPWVGAPSQSLPAAASGFTQLGWQIDLSRRAEGWIEARRDAPPAVIVRARLEPR